ncbi:MAG: hypothetical protein LBK99_16070 [Opitutaceae bacterium]|jgi:hypothetical protein|nr:hypothetical protein [Opitutaceae bacterium]
MWNSPNQTTQKGKRYQIADITALTYPLDQMLERLELLSVKQMLHEPILQRLEKDEFIYALYQVLEALLEDVPIPPQGHTGTQEAIIAELLQQTYDSICGELEDSEMGGNARQDAWQTIDRLLIRCTPDDPQLPYVLQDLKIDVNSSRIHLSEKLTEEVWKELLLGEGHLWDEFLWDDDWRMDSLMDLPPATAKSVTHLARIDLETVHKLAHTPDKAEYNMAEYYIRYIIWKSEALGTR